MALGVVHNPDARTPKPFVIFSAVPFMFYLHASCEAILRRRLNQQFFYSVVEVNRLEFPFVRKALEEFGVPVHFRPPYAA